MTRSRSCCQTTAPLEVSEDITFPHCPVQIQKNTRCSWRLTRVTSWSWRNTRWSMNHLRLMALLRQHNDRFWPLKDIVEDCLLLKVIRSCSDRMQHIADVEGCCAIKNGDVTVPAGTM
ncbi:uncharacterized protein LOC144114740 isoform X5 [Amblyomma americanum]